MRKKGNLDIRCASCGQQKKYWARNLCRYCWLLNRAETTLERYPNRFREPLDSRHQHFLNRLAEFNRLREQGYRLIDVADMTGYSLGAVKMLSQRANKQGLYVYMGNNAVKAKQLVKPS